MLDCLIESPRLRKPKMKAFSDWERAAEIERIVFNDPALLAQAMAGDGTHLPNIKGGKTTLIYGGKQAATVTATSWQTWMKPRNASMVYMLCVGSGGGGGAGFTAANGNAKGGGGGGASGATARILYPAFVLPRVLFLMPGGGGKGGYTSGSAGILGARSTITDKQDTFATVMNTLLISGAAVGTASQAGTAVGGQSGGTAETASLISAMGYATWAAGFTSLAGQAGSSAGSLGANGGNVIFGATVQMVSGGSGGGSSSAANAPGNGGTVGGAGLIPSIAGGVGVVGAGLNGNPGFQLSEPMICLGGSGGGSGTSGIGGFGGGGAPGCGGGGGGAGTTGGAGGDGGPGFILLVSW